MNRRKLLAGASALALTGCAGGRTPAALATPVPRALVPVNADWSQVIRTTVGLRPHRPAGFRIAVEPFGDRVVVHNYGHGGAGMSTSWGTAWLAADLALTASAERTAAVLGAGVVGLTTARQLQRRGFAVTVYASALPPDTTSNKSMACWTPASGLVELSERTPAFDEQFRVAAEVACRELQLLVGRGYGVAWIDTYTATDYPPYPRDRYGRLVDPLASLEERPLGPDEHPFATQYATVRRTLRIEPTIYLEALVRDVSEAGGRFVVRTFDGLGPVLALPERLVMNCTGLGAQALFGDLTLIPVKGQLTVLAPQPEVDYGIASLEGGFLHMAPRSDGIVLGGTQEVGSWSLEPDEAAMQRIVGAHAQFYRAMRRPT